MTDDALDAAPEDAAGQSGDSVGAATGPPLAILGEPLEVASAVLGETVCLVADDRQAETIWAKGGTPYTPPEVAILRELYAAVKPQVWAERLRLIHQAKREVRGILKR